MNRRKVFFRILTCLYVVAGLSVLAGMAVLAGCEDDPSACEQDTDCFSGEVCYAQRCTSSRDEGDTGAEPDAADATGGTEDGGSPTDSGGAEDSGGSLDSGNSGDSGGEEDAGPTVLKVEQVAVGAMHTCALLNDDTVQCWGQCSDGQCGNGDDRSPLPSPTEVVGLSDVRKLVSGPSYTCAIKNDDTLWCWGKNTKEQISADSEDSKLIPTETGLGGVQQVAPGYQHVCAIAAGELLCWGDYADGARNPPDDLMSADGVSTGYDHSCALVSGEVQCWGKYEDKKLGDGNPWIFGITDATSVEIGRYHSCALLGDQTVSCWGDDVYNQLGDLDGSATESPVAVENLNDVVELDVGNNHSCARTGAGAVKCWGSNNRGFSSETATSIFGLNSDVISIDVGVSHACAIKSSGELVCWGDNEEYKLGDGTDSYRDRPVTVEF